MSTQEPDGETMTPSVLPNTPSQWRANACACVQASTEGRGQGLVLGVHNVPPQAVDGLAGIGSGIVSTACHVPALTPRVV
jgi:hypothetical protein